MSVRLRYRIEASVSSTTAENRDLGNVTFESVHDTSGEGGSRKTTLATGATDVALAMAELAAARFVLVKTNAKNATDDPGIIEIKKNSTTNEVIEVVPLPDASEGHLLLSTQNISALFASNPGSVDMEVTVVSVGD